MPVPPRTARSPVAAMLLEAVAGYGGPGDSAVKAAGAFERGYAPIDGLKLYYEIHRAGRTPLVLIHGGGSTIESSFGNVLPFLAAHRKVIAVELQAHGRTGDREGKLSFERDADDVAGLLEYLKIARADICGFSNGGSTAMQIAIRHPELVNKLIIVSSFYKRDGLVSGLFEGLQNSTVSDMPPLLKEAYARVAADPGQLKVMFEKDKARMGEFTDWSDETVRSIKAKTLLIISDRDVVRPEHAIEMFRLLPESRLMILPGEHGAPLGEVTTFKRGSDIPRLTAGAMAEFLDE